MHAANPEAGGSAARPHQLDIVNKGVLRRLRNGVDRVWYYLDALPRLADRNHCDVIYCPAALTALRGRVPAVMTVFDMTTRLYPQTLDPLSRIYARQMLRIGLGLWWVESFRHKDKQAWFQRGAGISWAKSVAEKHRWAFVGRGFEPRDQAAHRGFDRSEARTVTRRPGRRARRVR